MREFFQTINDYPWTTVFIGWFIVVIVGIFSRTTNNKD